MPAHGFYGPPTVCQMFHMHDAWMSSLVLPLWFLSHLGDETTKSQRGRVCDLPSAIKWCRLEGTQPRLCIWRLARGRPLGTCSVNVAGSSGTAGLGLPAPAATISGLVAGPSPCVGRSDPRGPRWAGPRLVRSAAVRHGLLAVGEQRCGIFLPPDGSPRALKEQFPDMRE